MALNQIGIFVNKEDPFDGGEFQFRRQASKVLVEQSQYRKITQSDGILDVLTQEGRPLNGLPQKKVLMLFCNLFFRNRFTDSIILYVYKGVFN